MKRILFKYTLILTPIGLILTVLTEAGVNTWISFAVLALGLVLTGFMLYDLVKLIKTEEPKKKYAIYISIIIGELIVLTFFSMIFRESNLMAMIGANVLFASICAMLINIAKTVQNARMEIGCLLYTCIFISIVIIIINTVYFFVAIAQ